MGGRDVTDVMSDWPVGLDVQSRVVSLGCVLERPDAPFASEYLSQLGAALLYHPRNGQDTEAETSTTTSHGMISALIVQPGRILDHLRDALLQERHASVWLQRHGSAFRSALHAWLSVATSHDDNHDATNHDGLTVHLGRVYGVVTSLVRHASSATWLVGSAEGHELSSIIRHLGEHLFFLAGCTSSSSSPSTSTALAAATMALTHLDKHGHVVRALMTTSSTTASDVTTSSTSHASILPTIISGILAGLRCPQADAGTLGNLSLVLAHVVEKHPQSAADVSPTLRQHDALEPLVAILRHHAKTPVVVQNAAKACAAIVRGNNEQVGRLRELRGFEIMMAHLPALGGKA